MHRAGVAWHARSEVNAVAGSMPRTVDSNGSRWTAIAARDFDDRSNPRAVIPATDDVPEQRVCNSAAAVSSNSVLSQQVLTCLQNLAQVFDPVLVHTGPCYRVG